MFALTLNNVADFMSEWMYFESFTNILKFQVNKLSLRNSDPNKQYTTNDVQYLIGNCPHASQLGIEDYAVKVSMKEIMNFPHVTAMEISTINNNAALTDIELRKMFSRSFSQHIVALTLRFQRAITPETAIEIVKQNPQLDFFSIIGGCPLISLSQMNRIYWQWLMRRSQIDDVKQETELFAMWMSDEKRIREFSGIGGEHLCCY